MYANLTKPNARTRRESGAGDLTFVFGSRAICVRTRGEERWCVSSRGHAATFLFDPLVPVAFLRLCSIAGKENEFGRVLLPKNDFDHHCSLTSTACPRRIRPLSCCQG
eukprot:8205713-Pyramimonas_sp.AAC.1